MMTDTNRTILCYAAKEVQVLQMRMYDIYYSLIGVIHLCSSGTEEKIHTHKTDDFSPTSESRALTLNDMFLLASVGGFLSKRVHFTKSSLTAHTALFSNKYKKANSALYSPWLSKPNF